MKLFGHNFPVFVLLLAAITVHSVTCRNTRNYHTKHELVPKYEKTALDTCQPGDYYIISHVLAFYVAYATKYLGYKFDENCPVAVAACYTYVHKNDDCVYFWRKDTGTVQVVLHVDEVDYLVHSLLPYDVETLFDELVGANGATLSLVTATFAQNFKLVLQFLLDQGNHNMFLANFNGAVMYKNVFPEKGIYLNAKTSPLCELVDLKNPSDFLDAIEHQSSIVAFLRSVTDNPHTGSNQLNYHLPNHDACWRYVFGYLTLVDTLPSEVETLFYEAGLSTRGVDFQKLAYASLTVNGFAPYCNDLYKLWDYQVSYRRKH
ncbi:uncharacterized protein LOC129801256 [Phlebotomus papatasi]|uniref:uncharacterized protein LOC129801256 n=1 Tax=Phlebotomus papatasi TaxID=29031 RepID=UPI0024841A43|nr:uncharacterized protein LOC129801256 [Phlebotomus papatasi]